MSKQLRTALVLCAVYASQAHSAGIELLPPGSDDADAGLELVPQETPAPAATVPPEPESQPEPASEPAPESAPQPEPEPESAPARAMLIVDGSGSMWQELDGDTKIAIANEAVSDVLLEWPEGNELGLICLLYTSPSPRDLSTSRMPSSA